MFPQEVVVVVVALENVLFMMAMISLS